MKKNSYITLLSCALLLGTTGCSEQQIPLGYDSSPAIYFAWSSVRPADQRDSINHSFFLIQDPLQTRDTVWVQVNVLGSTAPVDRPFAVAQTNSGKANAALSGTHFLSFDDPFIKGKMMIPADSVRTTFPVVLFKDPSIALQSVRIEMEVVENEHFRPGIDAWRKFVVTTTSQAVKPSIWDTRWYSYFGLSWGTEKFRFIIAATGYTDWDVFPSDGAYVRWLEATAKQRFLEYNSAVPPNPPLMEADGTLVDFN